MRTPIIAAADVVLSTTSAAAPMRDTLTTSTILSPGDSLTSHACAAVLRDRLKFAEAGAFGARGGGRFLSSFDGDDASWHALAATLREQEGSPRVYAGEVLHA